MNFHRILILVTMSLLSVACVSKRKYYALLKKDQAAEAQLSSTRSAYSATTDSATQVIQQRDVAYNNLASSYTQLQSFVGFLRKRNAQDMQQVLTTAEARIRQRDSTMNALRQRLADALLPFQESGLSVELRDGLVHVSLSDKLLFASGSTQVEAQGHKALMQLATVLKQQPNLNIVVEGHTDDVAVRPAANLSDNWDLSVLRATDVVRILTHQGGVDASRITASGRGEFAPVMANDNATDKARNRRTEVIITPDFQQLYDIAGTNE